MQIDPNAIKYMVKAKINADGIVEKPDVVGAIFGQTEGLLGDELDLRDMQKSGRIGRIEVDVVSKGGKSEGIIYMSSSLDQVETVILASALETVDRVGPCKASIHVLGIEDIRVTKREKVLERAKELLAELVKQTRDSSSNLLNSVRESVQVDEITSYGKERCPAGPNVKDSEAIIIVEGRSDVLNLLKAGIKNAIAVEGTNIPKTVAELSKERVTTAFVDGDRGGELILRELFQVADIDFVARAPRAHEVEELSAKQLVKCLRNKVAYDQYMEMNNMVTEERTLDDLENQRTTGYSDNDHESKDDRHERKYADEERRERRYAEEGDDSEVEGEKPVRPRDLRGSKSREDRKARRERRSSKDRDEVRRNRFDDSAIEKYRKKDNTFEETKTETVEEEEKSVEPVVQKAISAPVEVPKIEAPAEPVEEVKTETVEEKPKKETKTRSRSRKQSDKVLSPEQEVFREMLLDLSTTHNAKVLNSENAVIYEVPVKNLVNTLKEDSKSTVAAIVFDGVISQRIVDVSSLKGIPKLIGTKKGNITKMPADVTIWTKEDLY